MDLALLKNADFILVVMGVILSVILSSVHFLNVLKRFREVWNVLRGNTFDVVALQAKLKMQEQEMNLQRSVIEQQSLIIKDLRDLQEKERKYCEERFKELAVKLEDALLKVARLEGANQQLQPFLAGGNKPITGPLGRSTDA